MAVINFVTNPLYMAHVLGLPWHTFYPGILRNLLSCGMLILLFGSFVEGVYAGHLGRAYRLHPDLHGRSGRRST